MLFFPNSSKKKILKNSINNAQASDLYFCAVINALSSEYITSLILWSEIAKGSIWPNVKQLTCDKKK